MTAALTLLRDEAMALIRATPDLAGFAPLPQALDKVDLPATTLPSVERFLTNPGAPIASTTAFTKATLAAAPDADWRQTYTEAEVGADFLAQYAWMEIWGPSGHFHCDDARAYVAFWGPHLYYDWHQHEAEEIYFLATGNADFEAVGTKGATVKAGETRLHTSNQPHAMTTNMSAILTLVLWRGSGLAGGAHMSPTDAQG